MSWASTNHGGHVVAELLGHLMDDAMVKAELKKNIKELEKLGKTQPGTQLVVTAVKGGKKGKAKGKH
jgi:hypothetical protein